MIALAAFWKKLGQAARLACGMPDYTAYLRHHSEKHPEIVPMSYEQFFADRMQARYRSGASRCC